MLSRTWAGVTLSGARDAAPPSRRRDRLLIVASPLPLLSRSPTARQCCTTMVEATLCAGSYERFLFGFSFQPEAGAAAAGTASGSGSDAPAASLQRSFIQAAHQGVVKCLAAGGQWVASGGADDLMHLYDIKARGRQCDARPCRRPCRLLCSSKSSIQCPLPTLPCCLITA